MATRFRTRRGHISFPQTVPLSQCKPGETVVLERINDDDPHLLRYLQGHGFVPGVRLHIEEGAPFSEAVNVSVVGAGSGNLHETDAVGAVKPGGTIIPLGAEATAFLFVSRTVR